MGYQELNEQMPLPPLSQLIKRAKLIRRFSSKLQNHNLSLLGHEG